MCSLSVVAGTEPFIDISNQTKLDLHCDDCSVLAELPFPLMHHCTALSSVFVSSNGYVTTDSLDMTSESMQCPDGAMCPFLADWTSDLSTNANVYVGYVGVSPNRVGVISWVDMQFVSDNSSRLVCCSLALADR